LNEILKIPPAQQAAAPDQNNNSPRNDRSSEADTAALLAELRATFDRLLTSFDGRQNTTAPPAAPEQPSEAPPAGPDAAELKRLLKLRARRRRKLSDEFGEWPAWDMLLDLAAVRAEGGHVSVSSVCISSGAPQSTALRKLAALENAKLVRRYFHGPDRRRVCIALTDEAAEMVMEAVREEAEFFLGVQA
jgi:DNA-binding transcriptional ArsR family regulator